MKIEHEMFAHHYILSGDKDKAYKIAYPHAKGAPLKIAARRLINSKDVRDYIDKHFTAAQEKAIKEQHAEEQRIAEEEYATMMLKRKMLRSMISGEYKHKRHIRVREHLEVVEEPLNPIAILRAIDIDTKLAKDWYNRAGQVKASAQVESAKEKPKEKRTTYSYPQEHYAEMMYGPDYMPGIRAEMVRDNPRKAEEYRQKGLRVLDHTLTLEEIDLMRETQMKKYEEWRALKKFADEQLEEAGYETGEEVINKEDVQEQSPTISKPNMPQQANSLMPCVSANTKTILNDTG